MTVENENNDMYMNNDRRMIYENYDINIVLAFTAT
jgi:hypothetical protein